MIAEADGAGDVEVTRERVAGIDPDLLAILVCPLTRTPLHWDPHASELVSEAAGLAFPVRDGVPIMIAEEARPLAEVADPGVQPDQIERRRSFT